MPEIPILLIIGFSFLNLYVGFAVSKSRKSSVRNYKGAPGSFKQGILALSLLGTIIGGGMFIGVSQIGFETGFGALVLAPSYLIGFYFLERIISRARHETRLDGCDSIFDVIEIKYTYRFANVSLADLFRIACFILYISFLAAQILVLTTLLSFYFPSISNDSLTIIASLIVFINSAIYTIYGGLAKDIITDVIQMVWTTLGVTLIIIISVMRFEPSVPVSIDYFTGLDRGMVFVVGLFLFTGPTLILRPDMWQRIVAAEDERTARKAFRIAGIFSFLAFLVFILVGIQFRLSGGGGAGLFFEQLISDPTIGYLIGLSLLGAVVSSADTFLNVSSMAIGDTIRRLRGKKASVAIYRFSSLFASILGAILATSIPDLVKLFSGGFGALMIFFPTFLMILYGIGNRSEKLIYWATTIGLLIYLGTLYFLPTEAFIVGLVVVLLVIGIGVFGRFIQARLT